MVKNINEMGRSLGFKIIIIMILVLLLLIPIRFIKTVINDRYNYQKDAISSITAPVGNKAYIEGIIIAIPYLNKYFDSETKEYKYSKEYLFYMPNEYKINGNVEAEILNRGIFKVPIFKSKMKITGNFSKYNSEIYNFDENIQIFFDEAMLIFGVGNKKNFLKLPEIILNENEIPVYYEKSLPINVKIFDNMFLFNLSKDNIMNGFDFDININIQGGDSLILTPLASDNSFEISSSWKDPSFTGGFLPTFREVSNNGFKAKWDIAGFNTSYSKYWITGENVNSIDKNNNVNISFLLLNDNYKKTSRSVKYAILFILIPFFVLFLCEVMLKKSIHPAQYILIGMTNAIFYLLLLAISEHINFNLSYLISSLMVIGLSSLYIGYIAKSKKYALSIAAVEAFTYIFLFGILQLTDYALLMGTLGLFLVIALAMYFTRNIDWYANNN